MNWCNITKTSPARNRYKNEGTMAVNAEYTFLNTMSRMLCRMRYERVLAIGRRLGPTVLQRLKKPRDRALSQMMTGLSLTREEAEPILQQHFEHLGMTAVEVLYTPRLVAEREHLERYITMDHPERLHAALAEQHGVVGLTAHVGNWEWLGAGLALAGFPTTTIAKRQPNDAITTLLNRFRTMAGLDVFHSGGSEIIGAARAIKRKKILGFLADKDGDVNGVPVMFLNRVSSAVEGPAVFARRFKSPIVPLFIRRREDLSGHVIHIGEPFYYEDTGNEQADVDRLMQRCTREIEDFILRYPPEWLWVQRRWWTEPEQMRRYRGDEAVR